MFGVSINLQTGKKLNLDRKLSVIRYYYIELRLNPATYHLLKTYTFLKS